MNFLTRKVFLKLAGVFPPVFFIVWIILWFLFGIKAYRNFSFTSDGFHYFSTLRNFWNGHGFFEGPTFENLLGNHAYLTLFLIAPLIKIFSTPLLLLFLTITAHTFSAWLIYKISLRFNQSIRISFCLAFLYLMYPTIYAQMWGIVYLFQPDYLLPPLSLLLSIAYLQKKLFWTCLWSFLLVATKEEYILVYPFLIFWNVILWKEDRGAVTKREYLFLLVLFIIVSMASVATLFFYRNLNETNYAARAFNLWILFDQKTWLIILQKVCLAVCPLLPLFTAHFFIEKTTKGIGLLFYCCFVFIFGRFVLSAVVYGKPSLIHWASIVFVPQIFLWLSRFVGAGAAHSFKRRNILCIAMGICLIISSFLDIRLSSIIKAQVPKTDSYEIFEMRKKIPSADREYEYFIAPQYLIFPFMDRSHFALEIFLNLKEPRKNKILKDARFIIVPKNTDLERILKDNQKQSSFETEHYSVFLSESKRGLPILES